MSHAPEPSEPLSLLARLFRERRSGVLSIGPAETALRVLLRDGQIVGLGPISASSPAPRPRLPRPDDSARRRLDRVLAEIGIRSLPAKPAPATAPPSRNLRERVLETLADRSLTATFEEGADVPADVAETAGATEPLILEAVRQMRDAGTVRTALGDLDQRLVATAALAEERTLTLIEGYLLSRVDGTTPARQVLQLLPLDPEETERTLLGLLLTGRVEYRAEPAPQAGRPPEPAVAAPTPAGEASEPGAPPAHEAGGPLAAEAHEAFPEVLPVPDEPSGTAEAPAPLRAALDPKTLELRRHILEVFQSLPGKNHFEVLGVEPGCSDADVKRAHAALAKRYHPDVHRDPRVRDLHDNLVAIFIRVGEAWEALGDARSRASYEARHGVGRRPQGPAPPHSPPESGPARTRPPQSSSSSGPIYVLPEDALFKARLLLSLARYSEAIQVLESRVPQMEERRHQHKGRILLAKAYAQNPSSVRRAEETLQIVVREDPANVDAHYELGLLYKAGGLAARAQAMFRRVLELRPDHREAAAELGPAQAPGASSLLKRLFGRGKSS
jgi:tetratricopeptide (TPR) repeat protein